MAPHWASSDSDSDTPDIEIKREENDSNSALVSDLYAVPDFKESASSKFSTFSYTPSVDIDSILPPPLPPLRVDALPPPPTPGDFTLRDFCDDFYNIIRPRKIFPEADRDREQLFGIQCNAPHDGSYVGYEPSLECFKDTLVKDGYPYEHSLFWCRTDMEHFVHVFRVDGRKLCSPDDHKTTWGERFLYLYSEAEKAARTGCDDALDLLVRLPDRDAPINGGWLFEFYKLEFKRRQPITWGYVSAHRIEDPITYEERWRRIRKSLGL